MQLAAGLIEAELAAGERIFGVLDANNRRVRRHSPMMSSGTSSCSSHRGGPMRRPGCCCSLGSRAAQVYWLAKCHTPLASAIGPKRPSTQPQTTATYKTPYAHPNIQTHCHLEHRQSSHWWICDNPTSLLHPTTSSTSNFKLHRHALPPHACGEGPVVRACIRHASGQAVSQTEPRSAVLNYLYVVFARRGSQVRASREPLFFFCALVYFAYNCI